MSADTYRVPARGGVLLLREESSVFSSYCVWGLNVTSQAEIFTTGLDRSVDAASSITPPAFGVTTIIKQQRDWVVLFRFEYVA